MLMLSAFFTSRSKGPHQQCCRTTRQKVDLNRKTGKKRMNKETTYVGSLGKLAYMSDTTSEWRL